MYSTIIYHTFRKSKCYMDISRRVKIGKVIYTAEKKKRGCLIKNWGGWGQNDEKCC